MRRALVLLLALLATSLVGVRQSAAQFGECTDAYIDGFRVPANHGEPEWTPGQIRCRELFFVDIETPRGTIAVRGIGDVDVEATLPPDGIEAIRRGVERSGRALQQIEDFDLYDTTILISRPRVRVTDPQVRGGYSDAWTQLGRTSEGNTECHITLFARTDSTAEEAQYAVAHELFHCVQNAEGTGVQAQMATAQALGAWWAEGAPEWFAAFAIGPQPRWRRGPQFDEAVADRRPLYTMTYQAAVFFYWLHQTQGGPDAIIPFMRRMAINEGAPAQQEAMQAVLSQDRWLDFAKAYDDRTINYPGGGPVNFGQQPDGDRWEIEETSQFERELKPFVISVGWAHYACGLWRNVVNEANVQVHPQHQNRWSSWPGELDVREPTATRHYRMIAMHAFAGDGGHQRLSAERRESCNECMTRAVIDQCVVGTWEMTGGGPMDFLRSQGIPQVTRDAMGRLVMTMREDGTYTTRPVPLDYQITIPDDEDPMVSDAEGQIGATSGRWSAEEGVMTVCLDEDAGATAQTTTQFRGGTMNQNHRSFGMAGTSGTPSYTCSDTTLTTSTPMGSGTNMTYTFQRLTRPPRRR